MKTVSIKYNPYYVTTQIMVDGKEPAAGMDYVQITKGTRLLNWIDNFLIKFFQKHRDPEVAFEFFGTVQDAEDLRAAIDRFNKNGQRFRLDKVHTSQLGDSPLKSLKKIYEDGKNGPFAEIFQSEQMEMAFNRAIAPEFEVNVIATMSSGKSTLINALLGKNLMPSKQEACTATIASIEDCDNQQRFTALRYDATGKLLTEKPEIVTRKLLTQWNDDKSTSKIEIKGNIPTVNETSDSKYVFIDTPGPNNSRDEAHKRKTFEAITSKPLSMIIYVLNAGNFGVDDDDSLLHEVAKAMSEGGRQAQDRFIFVLNKVDDFRQDEDSVANFLTNAKEYLNKHGIANPLIIPVSAKLAKLLRIQKYSPEDLIEEDQDDLDRLKKKFLRRDDLHLFEYCKGSVNQEVIQRIEEKLSKSSEDDKVLIYSGLPVLEELLQDFLYRHALPAKLKDAVDTFDRVLHDYEKMQNLNKILQQSDEEIKAAAQAISDFTSSRDSLAQAEKFKREIEAITFDLSPATKQKINSINEDREFILEKLKSRLDKGDVSPYEAERLCSKAEGDCKNFENGIQLTLQNALKEECHTQMNQLRDKYQEYITSILKTAFPNNDMVQKLEFSVFDMPKTEELISDNKHHKQEVVGQKRVWWKLWIGKIDITEDREYVDLTPVYDNFALSVREFTRENIKEFTNQANADLENSKKQLIQIMDTKQEEMKHLEEAIRAAGKNKSEKEKQKRDAEMKIAWFQGFHSSLLKILDI